MLAGPYVRSLVVPPRDDTQHTRDPSSCLLGMTRAIGTSVARRDGVAKVTGATRYAADVHLEGTLVAGILRSPWPYARIVSIDASAARHLAGVHAVLTGRDIPELLAGRSLGDVPVLCRSEEHTSELQSRVDLVCRLL